MTGYQHRLESTTSRRGALCVGIDPHPALLKEWGLEDTVTGLETCARTLVEAVGDQVAVFKPQSAFFERHGSRGIAVLERVLADIRAVGALSILDVKRGDIGSTMAAYAQAYLADDAPLAADAITVAPYLGFGSLRPAFDLAEQTGRGVYVLARTSNPEGDQVQLSKGLHGTVVQQIIDAAQAYNATAGQSVIGIVVGATHKSIGCDLSHFTGSILVPGIGAQGGRIEDMPMLFGDAVHQVLPMVGRAVLGRGPDVSALREAVVSLLTSGI